MSEGNMTTFAVEKGTAPAYLALPSSGKGPGVMVLHAWWGLTDPFRKVCDRLAEEGFVALGPDLYRGKTTAAPDEAKGLVQALDRDEARWRGHIAGAVQELHRHEPTVPGTDRGKVGLVGFSMGAAYALGMSVDLADDIAAVVTYYASWDEPEYSRAKAAYLCHFAEDDAFEPAESAAAMVRALQAAGRLVTSYTYPGTKHWFVEEDRPEYDAAAAQLAWERTVKFLHQQLG